MSNAQKVKGIRGNRSMEKEERRKEEAFLLADSDQSTQRTISEEHVEDTQPKKSVSRIELLRQKQKEKLMHAKNSQ
ncbi:hypothetical protein ETC05_14230 [Geobacillus sp. BMUD]|nr:hypothetical protein [Geobacillus sp. BMUD]NNU84931.1 hypothetical protein [Geobacillus sp. BMUD]